MTEELGIDRESLKASEEWVADLERTAAMLQEDLSSARERSSEVDKLQEEQAKLIARCGKLEEAVCQEAVRVCEVPLEAIKKIKEDYLASEEF